MDGLGGLFTAFRAAMDVGKNDDQGGDGGGDDWGQMHDDAGVADSGGYWEYPYTGGPAIWHPASFSHGYQGGPNEETFNPENGNSFPGGGGQPSGGAWGGGRGFGK